MDGIGRLGGVLVCGVLGVAIASLGAGLGKAYSSDRGGKPVPRVIEPYGVDIQAVFDAAGNPLVVANFSPDGSLAQPSWTICLPGAPSPLAPRSPPPRSTADRPTPPTSLGWGVCKR